MKKVSAFMVALLVVALPLGAMGMEGMEHGEHGKMKEMKHAGMHEGMMMEEGMAMLGEETEHGVKGMAHLKDVEEAMAKMGMKETHHFMIMFMDIETGEPLEKGAVAGKVEDPSGKEGKAVKLMGMQGHFGADIVLSQKGEYHFKVGTKLKDGKKRQYHFHYTVE